MPRIACPGCEKSYNVSESAAGKVATCKACGGRFTVGFAEAKAKAAPAPSSIWDELDDEYEVAPTSDALSGSLGDSPFGAQSAPARVRSEPPAWHAWIERAFRAICLAGPPTVWVFLYVVMSQATGPEHRFVPVVLCLVGFGVSMIIGLILAKHGISLDGESWKRRAVGLCMVAGGAVVAIAGLSATALISYLASFGFFIILGGLGAGVTMMVVGALQIVTGRKIRS